MIMVSSMKKEFRGYYSETESDLKKLWKSNHTIFVFDTNVLLNLYSYIPQTREDFYSIVSNIKNKIWMPYQVGIEYQNRRLHVIKNEKSTFQRLSKYVEDID